MSEKNIVKLLEQISVPLTSSRDCNQAFIVAYDIYSDGYHHSYSEVTRFLLRNQNSEFDNIEKLKQILLFILDNINILIKQFDDIKTSIESEFSNHEKFSKDVPNFVYLEKEGTDRKIEFKPEKLENVKKALNKLYDHISLELIRLDFFNSYLVKIDDADKKVNSLLPKIKQITEAQKNVDSLQSEIKKVKVAQSKLNTSIDNHKIEIVTILGIFASIVFAFAGAFSMSNSILSNFANAKSSTLFLYLVLTVGFITNILFYLFSFISSIHDKDSKLNWKFSLGFNGVLLVLCLIAICYPKASFFANDNQNSSIQLVEVKTKISQD